jgi:hypothetical protein
MIIAVFAWYPPKLLGSPVLKYSYLLKNVADLRKCGETQTVERASFLDHERREAERKSDEGISSRPP